MVRENHANRGSSNRNLEGLGKVQRDPPEEVRIGVGWHHPANEIDHARQAIGEPLERGRDVSNRNDHKRGGSHKGLVGAAKMMADGLCDVLVSDYHYPSLLNAPFRLAEELKRTLEKVWPMVSEYPAQILGLTDRGTLQPGQRGDVIMWRARSGKTGRP